jgi:hypothetical protein
MFEAHPVPQNVTEFEFHLVGDMTIKQFIYLASGIGLAYLTFALIASKLPFLAYPLIIIFAGSGAALAFLPIQERPLDHWLGAYFKAIFQPTKRVYKSKLITKEDPLFKTRLQVYINSKRTTLSGLNIPNKNVKSTPFSFNVNPAVQQAAAAPIITAAAVPPPVQTPPPTQPVSTVLGSAPLSPMSIPSKQEVQPVVPLPLTQPEVPTPSIPQPAPIQKAAPLPSIPQIPVPTPAPMQLQAQDPATGTPQPGNNASTNQPAPTKPSFSPNEDELKKTIEVAKQAHQVQQKIVKTEEQINLIRSKAATQDANPKEYLDQFHQLLGELQNLNQQAANLSQQVALLTNEPAKQINVRPELVVKAKSIPTITLTSIPNVLNGIVTDSKGNYLDGSIILAHDKQGIPVRALKTNKLGQFVAATPLNNGVYTITIEKDTLVFDTIEIELSGTVLKPILITAKPVGEGG